MPLFYAALLLWRLDTPEVHFSHTKLNLRSHSKPSPLDYRHRHWVFVTHFNLMAPCGVGWAGNKCLFCPHEKGNRIHQLDLETPAKRKKRPSPMWRGLGPSTGSPQTPMTCICVMSRSCCGSEPRDPRRGTSIRTPAWHPFLVIYFGWFISSRCCFVMMGEGTKQQ